MMHRYLLKAIPKWTGFGLVLALFFLAAVIFIVNSAFFPAYKHLAYLSILHGEVKVSDGITDSTAKDGSIDARNVPTILKTNQGIASLVLWDGSFVIIDSDSIIEFNRQFENSPEITFIFNLVKGRVIIVNGEGSQLPTHLFIGGDNAVQVFHTVMGLEVSVDDKVNERVDCLVGQCLVNGVYWLTSGQKAQIAPGSIVQVGDGVHYDSWLTLMKLSNPGPDHINMFTSVYPTMTQFNLLADLSKEYTKVFPAIGNTPNTSAPSSSLPRDPTETPEPGDSEISTQYPDELTLPGLTTYPIWAAKPTTTPTATWFSAPPATALPNKTPTLQSTPSPTHTHTTGPPDTITPRPTLTPIPTPLPAPTSTLQPTTAPTFTLQPTTAPTFTLQPTAAPTFTLQPTSAPTLTSEPSQTPIPPPTSTPKPPPAPTNTKEPTRTPKPKPTKINTPTAAP